MDTKALIAESQAFIRDEVHKRGFKRAILGLSGGIDSALVATLATNALGASNLQVLIMPSITSNKTHIDDAKNLAHTLHIDAEVLTLSPFQKVYKKILDNAKSTESTQSKNTEKLRIGNFCARMRMALLYDRAFATSSLVLGTSNKSEILLGYGTIFGDLACAINPIGSLYKSEVFTLARAIGIPSHIIEKKPSADLFINQSDEADLGYSYKEIDVFLRAFLAIDGEKAKENADKMQIKAKLIAQGFESAMTNALCTRVWNNTFKREMPCIFMPSADSMQSMGL